MMSIASAPTNANRRIQQSLMLASRLQAKQRELEGVQKEMQTLKKRLETSDADLTLNKRLLTKTNQPNSYMIADIEKAERELDFAQRKIKSLEDHLRKLKVENDSLKMAKKSM
jgi:chromosome segregation ATPase